MAHISLTAVKKMTSWTLASNYAVPKSGECNREIITTMGSDRLYVESEYSSEVLAVYPVR